VIGSKAVAVGTDISVGMSVGKSGTWVTLTVGGLTVYLDEQSMARLRGLLCDAETAAFNKPAGWVQP
jgi:hypothetical protein